MNNNQFKKIRNLTLNDAFYNISLNIITGDLYINIAKLYAY